MAWKASLNLIFCIQLVASSAHAAAEAATLSTTRELAKQGLTAYDAGRYDEAVEKLSKAYAVVRLPTLAVATARALAKQGKLIAASELYLEATRIEPEQSWQSTQRDAQGEAERERSELLQRIPRLRIAIRGASATDVTITIDDTTIPHALIDTEQMVDPGRRLVKAVHGDEVVERQVMLEEGKLAQIELEFSPAMARAATPPRAAAHGPRRSVAPLAPDSQSSSRSGQAIAGWTGVALGGLGIAIGATAGVMAIAKRSSLLDDYECSSSGRSCPPSSAGGVDSYNSMRTVAQVGLIAGGIVAAAGVTLILTSPKRDNSPAVGLWIGPTGTGIYGGF